MKYPPSAILVSNLFSVGPAYGAICRDLAEKLLEGGWRVTTTSSAQNRFVRPIDMLTTIWRTRNRIDVAQVDVFSGKAFLWAELATQLLVYLRKPTVLTLHGGNLPFFALRHTKRVCALLNKATHVTTPSRYLLSEMHQYRQDSTLIPNPIDIKPYTFRLRSKPAPKLLFLRALHRIYNPVLAVQVLHHLLSKAPDAHLSVVGPDKADGVAKDLYAIILDLSLQDKTSVEGAIVKEKVPQVMARNDIFLNTANTDNTPISVIEAMACGLCIVSTNVGGIPYLLANEYNALLVPPNDPAAMSNAIWRILTTPELAETLSRNARATAEMFDWSVIFPKWNKLLIELIEKQKHG